MTVIVILTLVCYVSVREFKSICVPALISALVHQVFIIIEQVAGQEEVSAFAVYQHPVKLAAGCVDVCCII